MSDTSADRWLGAWRNRPEARELAAAEVARLGWLYISRLSAGRRSDDLIDLLARLGGRDLAYLKALRFLASPQAAALTAAGASLLRRLPQSTRQAKCFAREARGRIDWAATIKERLARGRDPTVFVVSRADRHTDVAENRALTYILHRMAETGRTLRYHPEIASRGLEAERLLSTSALMGVQVPIQLSGMDRQALRMSRVPEFREQVGAAIDLHDGLFADDLKALRKTLGDQIWLPPEADKLFELWVMFAIVESLVRSGWRVANVRLIGISGGAAPTFILIRENCEVRVAYQAVPKSFLQTSRYKEILDAYDIDGSVRRPDILLSVPAQNGAVHLLVEAKLTENRDYIVESIYKVLGYVGDFQDSLANTPNPKGVLVVWAGVAQTGGGNEIVRILSADAIREGGFVPLIEALVNATATSEVSS